MADTLRVGILGAGNGAHAMAAHLSLMGHPVRLYNKFAHEIEAMQKAGGITVEGAVEGFGRLEVATTDPAQVIPWADVLLVVVPAFAHRVLAQAMAPYLRDDQVILLNPGRTGGALEVRQVLREEGVQARVYVAEAQTLVYACRIQGPARVRIMGIKQQVPVAALPASDNPIVLEKVGKLYPQFIPAPNVLHTSLDNIGAVFHPATVVFNANRIEAGEEFEFYRGMTPTVAAYLEVIDAERVQTAEAYGVPAQTAMEWLQVTYPGVEGKNLYECIQSTQAYAGIMAPKTLNVRYISEDIPTGLVPIVSFARAAGIDTPASRAIADVCCVLHRKDYWSAGRTLENLGLAGMEPEGIIRYVSG